MRILGLVAFIVVLYSIPASAGALKFTATPWTPKLDYFNIVDESLVPHLPEAHVNGAQSNPAGGPLALPTVFNAQHEPYKQGVERPDMGLAVGPKFIVQSVNAQVGVYTTSGERVKGWPKAANLFLGLPSSSFVVDTRAEWDPWDHRFWVTYLCPHGYCLAVSQTSDPNGKWYVYGFDLGDGPKVTNDFGMMAFDQHTISISTHLITFTHGVLKNLHSGFFTIDKRALESGSTTVAPQGFVDVHTSGHDLDTVEPVLVSDPTAGQPAGEFFLSTEGFNFPCYGGIPAPCTKLFLFMISGSGSTQTISGQQVGAQPYRFTPVPDTPRCKRCLEAVGPMMTTSPVYRNGLISYAFGTGMKNSTQNIAAIRWGQIAPTVAGTQLTDARVYQEGTLEFPGDLAAIFPSVMTDYSGNLFVLFDESSATLNPSVAVAARRASDPLNQLTSTQLVRQGVAPPNVFPWGDYTAAAFSGGNGPVWFASEFAGVNDEFGTVIFNVKF